MNKKTLAPRPASRIRAALLLACLTLPGCAFGPCLFWQPGYECLSPEEGAYTWRSPEERQALRDALQHKLVAIRRDKK